MIADSIRGPETRIVRGGAIRFQFQVYVPPLQYGKLAVQVTADNNITGIEPTNNSFPLVGDFRLIKSGFNLPCLVDSGMQRNLSCQEEVSPGYYQSTHDISSTSKVYNIGNPGLAGTSHATVQTTDNLVLFFLLS